MDFRALKVDDLGNIAFGFGSETPQSITGINKLVQLIVLKLLKTPGRDIISPETGGGLLQLIGGNTNPDDPREMISDISPKIKKAESEIIYEQMNSDIDAAERLQKLNIIDVSVDPANITSYNVTIEVINESEQVASATIGVSLINQGS